MTRNQSDLSRREFWKTRIGRPGGTIHRGCWPSDCRRQKGGEKNPLLSDPHVCRGLNTCKAKGAGKKNSCAGTGQCATAAKHAAARRMSARGRGLR